MKKIIPFFAALTILSCTIDSYEKGDGENSFVQADFVEAYTNAERKVDYVVTDDQQRLTLQTPYEAEWLEKADSFYRAVLYYEKGDEQVAVVTLAKIPVAVPIPKDSLKSGIKTDPLTIESIWVSKNKRYLNVGFYAKVGATDDKKAIHSIGLVMDTLVVNPDKTQTLCLLLYHDQGGVPEYYSQKSYFSFFLKDLGIDSISLSANTYQGRMVKTLPLR